MRLRKVEAVRFGRLEGASLGDLGDGLTVVLGPNEAGKSTYTALVRHVLYGFPTPGAKEPRFLSDRGKRQGRLVFEDGNSAWAIERTEGVHGGPASVNTLRGADRPSLLDEIRHGVSGDAYRVVLGFGLAELAQIEDLRGKDDDIVSRLYAAGAGLAVSPQDVRASVNGAAEELWAPRASAKTANKAYAQMREIRARLRELEDEASRYTADQERLVVLEAELASAREARDTTSVRRRELERDATALEEREREIDALATQLLQARKACAALTQSVESLCVDELLLAEGAQLDSLLSDLSAHRERLDRLSGLAATVESLAARVAAQLGTLGLTEGTLPQVTPDTVATAEKWRETLSRAELLATQSERAASEAEARAVAAEETAAAAKTPAGARSRVPVVAWAVMGAGLLSAIAGVLSSQHVATAVGALLVILGVILGVLRPGRGGAVPLSADAARLDDRVTDAREAASSAAAMARADAEGYATYRREWRAWLATQGLSTAGEDPAGVAAFLSEIRSAQGLIQERVGREAEAAREREVASDYARRLSDAVKAFMPESSDISAPEAPVVAERVRQQLGEARAAAEQHSRAIERLAVAQQQIRDLEEAQAAATDAASQIIGAHGLEDGGLAALKGLEDGARADAESAVAGYDMLAEAVTALKTELGREGRESEMGDLRLELTSLDERRNRAGAEYAVLAVASRLLSSAQERYERERQPEVVRTAEAVFERITDGRYTGLAVPLGGSEIRVFGRDASAHATAELSRGTAEQMYLALRIGLIEQLGEVGSALPVLMDDILVNFDAERRMGAAQAIADLATSRQVVFFTCHPETAEMLAQVAPGRELLELGRCEL
jgi:uncharacterized protein YhaN